MISSYFTVFAQKKFCCATSISNAKLHNLTVINNMNLSHLSNSVLNLESSKLHKILFNEKYKEYHELHTN